MFVSDIEAITETAVKKQNLLKNHLFVFLMRAIVAGFFLVVAGILSNVTAAIFFNTLPAAGKFLGSFLFSLAIVMIVFLGGELFTGHNFTMAIGLFNKKVKISQLLMVWFVTYIGNLIGSVFFSYLFVKSGASANILTEYIGTYIMNKLELTPLQMVLRGVLCNFCVCLAVVTGYRMKSESGKLIVMFLVITTFVITGFEHCIANMGTFSIAYFLLDGLPWNLILKSMVYVTIGNIIGGSVLLALPLKIMSIEDTDK